MTRNWRTATVWSIGILAFAGMYFTLGIIGLSYPYQGRHVTLVWPPTGVALAVLYRAGACYWPGLTLGAFAVNILVGNSWLVCASIALGNTLGPLLGATLLRRWAAFNPTFARQRDLGAFLLLGVLGTILVPATGGVLSLCAGGLVSWGTAVSTWAIWLLGDSLGVLIVAPPLLTMTLANFNRLRDTKHRLEILGLLLALVVVSVCIFFGLFGLQSQESVFTYLPLSALLWIALRGGTFPATWAMLAMAILALMGTVQELSPFSRDDMNLSLLLLWMYLTTASIMTLLVTTLQSERAQAEEGLRISHVELETIFHALPDLYFRMMPDGTILDFQTSRPQDLYIAPRDFMGRRMPDVLPSEVAPAVQQGIDRALATRRPITVEYELTVSGGSQDFEARFMVLPGPQVLAVIRNISDRKRVESQLQQSEARFRAFMEHSPVLAFIKDHECRYIYANPRWESQFPVPRKDWAGKTDFAFFPEATAQLFQASDKSVLSSAQSREVLESALTQENELRHFLSYKFVLADTHGQPAIGGFVLDITASKRLEEQLRQSHKMEAVGQLAGGIAHDFNNLLTVINGFSSMMLTGLGANNPWHGIIQEILKAGERAADLTRQLLAFSRKQVLQPCILDLNVILDSNIKMLGRLLGEQLELVTKLDPRTPRVKADPSQFEQAIVNLALNARDAMPHGGILTLATSPLHFDGTGTPAFPGMAPGTYAMVCVVDNGNGIDPAVLPRIFEPFFTTKDVGQGTGLGLAMVYGIVQQSGGHIDVLSELGQGTTFRIFLPATQAPPSNGSATSQPQPWPQGQETILLVEDEYAVRNLNRKVLERCGYTVLEASHGKHALDVFANHSGPIHLLLSDVRMPLMNGPALADQLCALHPHLKVLLISGYASPSSENESPAGQGYPLLEKPCSPSTLTMRVREILGPAC